MRLPALLLLCAAYAGGVLLRDVAPAPAAPLFILAMGLLLLGLGYRMAFPLMLFSALGWGLASLADARLERSALASYAAERPTAVRVVGTVASTPLGESGRMRFVLNASRMDFPETLVLSEKVRVEADEASLGVAAGRGASAEAGTAGLELGRQVAVEGLLQLPRASSGFGFDFSRHLRHEGISAVLRASDLEALAEPASPLAGAVSALRQEIKQEVSRALSGDRAGLMLGILIGDTSGISKDLVRQFRETGLTHIVAVSGMNVGLLSLIVLYLLGKLPLGRAARAVPLAGVLVFYAALTGGQPPVMRATVMALVALLAWVILRRHDLLSSISAAALALLIYNPFLLYDVGFQLSFLATLGILLGIPALGARWPFFGTRLGSVLAVSLTAQLAVTPVLAYHFNQFSVVSLPANAAAVPAVGPILALGVGAVSVGWAFPWAADLLNWLAGWLLLWVIACARFFASLPWASLSLASPSLVSILAYYGCLLGAIFVLSHPGRRRLPAAGFAAASLLALLLWGQVLKGTPPSHLEVKFFNVGQGDSALLRAPGGGSVLVDGGPYEGRALELLSREGVSRLDLVVISHPQEDHAGAIPAVLSRYPVGRVLWAPAGSEGPLVEEVKRLVRSRGIPASEAVPGDRWLVGPELALTVLSPLEDMLYEENDRSVVARVDYGKVSFLFTGDVEQSGQQALTESMRQGLESAVLKVPHHGSAGSSDETFFREVRPRVAVISVGRGNKYGHPSRKALKRLKDVGAAVYRTDRDGTVTVRTDGARLAVEKEEGWPDSRAK